MTPELQLKVAEWRQKARDGVLTKEECREAIALLREGRQLASAASTSSKSRKTTTKKSVDTASLLDELEGL